MNQAGCYHRGHDVRALLIPGPSPLSSRTGLRLPRGERNCRLLGRTLEPGGFSRAISLRLAPHGIAASLRLRRGSSQ